MIKTKSEKIAFVKERQEKVKNTGSVVFASFNGVSVNDMQHFRKDLMQKTGASMQVAKKRLLNIVFKEAGVDFDNKAFQGQMGVIYGNGDISEIAQAAHGFAKTHKGFVLVGGANLGGTIQSFSGETVNAIGQLPSREVLLGQVLGACTGPVRGFMYILQERAKQLSNA